MNILFIEDDIELSKNAVFQLEGRGNTVRPVFDLVSARAVLADPEAKIQLVIADHQLPDGLGIPFVIKMKMVYPQCFFIVVSGLLTSQDMERLDEAGITYYQKPLLYGKIVDEYRRAHAQRTPVVKAPEGAESAEGADAEESAAEVVPEAPLEAKPDAEAASPAKPKKRFGLF